MAGSDDNLGALGPRKAVPRAAPGVDWRSLSLDPNQGFVLSRVDGRTSLGEICLLVPFPERDTTAILASLHGSGLIEIPGAPPPSPPAYGQGPNLGPPIRGTAPGRSVAPPTVAPPSTTSPSTPPAAPATQQLGWEPQAFDPEPLTPLPSAPPPFGPPPPRRDTPAAPAAAKRPPTLKPEAPSEDQVLMKGSAYRVVGGSAEVLGRPAGRSPRTPTPPPEAPEGPTIPVRGATWPPPSPAVPPTSEPPATEERTATWPPPHPTTWPPAAPDAEPRDASPPRGDEPCDLAPEMRARVDEMASRIPLDDPFALLDVARGVDKKELRRAYFRLSKEFHPDRYYGRRLGAYQRKLQQVFTALSDAFEALSDDARRAEIEQRLRAR